MALSKEDLKALRHPKEGGCYRLTLFVLIPLGGLAAILTVASLGTILLLAPVVLFFLWLSLKLFVASFMNNTILVTPESFPRAHAAVEEAKDYFGYTKNIEAYVYQEGNYNASLMQLLNIKVLLLPSELMRAENSADEVRFIVGRFVGGLASKHYRFMWLQAFLDGVEKLAIFNILLYPYERALKLSGDRLGLAMIGGDIETAVRVMMKLVVGTDVVDQANVRSFIQQGKSQEGSFFRWLVKAFSPFPHHTVRVNDLMEHADQAYPEKIGAVRLLPHAAE